MSLLSVVPLWGRLLFIVGALFSIWLIGDLHGKTTQGEKDELVADKVQHAYDVRIKTADDALIAANARANAATHGATTDQTAITAAYAKGKKDEADASKVRLAADFAAGRQRMRIDASCKPADAGSRRELPRPAAAAAGPDAAATFDVELNPDAYRRFKSTSDRVIGALGQQVIALQALAQSEHDRCNQVGTAPATIDEPAKKRVFGFGKP